MPIRPLLLCVAVVLTLAGCAPGGPSAPATSSSIASPSASDSPTTPVPLAALKVGDCTGPIDLTGASMNELPPIDCGQAHYYEVYATVPVLGDAYPGGAVLGEQAKTDCAPLFAEFIGAPAEYSRYSSAYLMPDEAAWARPENRAITCLAGTPEGGLLGSAKGDSQIFPEKGQCTGPQDVSAVDVEIIDCAQVHYYEVFAAQEVKPSVAPSAKEVDKLFSSVCVDGFKKFVGIDTGKSKYEVTYFIANAEVWPRVGDHRIVCSAGSPTGGLTGSLKGSKK